VRKLWRGKVVCFEVTFEGVTTWWPHVIHSTSIPPGIWSPWSRSVMLRSTNSEHPRLISHEIIFEVFQSMWPRYLNVTDGQCLPWQYHAVHCITVKSCQLNVVGAMYTRVKWKQLRKPYYTLDKLQTRDICWIWLFAVDRKILRWCLIPVTKFDILGAFEVMYRWK